MKIEDQQKLQELLNKKQQWIQKAIKELQKGNHKKASQLVNFDSGCNVSIVKMLEAYIPEEEVEEVITETVETVEEVETVEVVEDIDDVESTYEDIKTEDEEGR